MSRLGESPFDRWQRRLRTAYQDATPAQQARIERVLAAILARFADPERQTVSWRLNGKNHPLVLISGLQAGLVAAGLAVKIEYTPGGSWRLEAERPPFA